jgi:hypothetical protein
MAIALTVAYTATPLAAGVKLAVYATKPLSAGVVRPSPKQFQLLAVTAAAAVSPVNVLSAYTAKYGALVSGQKIFFRTVAISASGIASAPFDSSAVVA